MKNLTHWQVSQHFFLHPEGFKHNHLYNNCWFKAQHQLLATGEQLVLDNLPVLTRTETGWSYAD